MPYEDSIPENDQSRQSAAQEQPPKPHALVVIPESIPDELKAIDQWVVWRYLWLKDRQKWDKPPLQSHGGNLASTTNPKTWSTFDAAMFAYGTGTVDGIGFVFAKKNRLTGIDLDHARDPETGIIDAWALEMINRFRTYTELSCSGRGIHLIGSGTLPGPGVKTAQVEMYDDARFFTMTGHRLEVPSWT
jgi:putative DNA primase/helicase